MTTSEEHLQRMHNTFESFRSFHENIFPMLYGDILSKPKEEKKKYLYFYAGAIDILASTLERENENEKWFYGTITTLIEYLGLSTDVMENYGIKSDISYLSSSIGVSAMQGFLRRKGAQQTNQTTEETEDQQTRESLVLINHLQGDPN